MPVRKLHTPDALLAAAKEAKAKWLRKERDARNALREAQMGQYLALGKVVVDVGGAALDADTLRAILQAALGQGQEATKTSAVSDS